MTKTLRCAALLAALVAAAPAGAVEPPRFTVAVGLSAQAAETLARGNETITVAAMYAGEPTKAAARRAVDGEIDLGREEGALGAQGGTASFVGRGFQARRLALVKPGTARVLINVYSARRSNPDNLLDCGIFEDTLAAAAAKPIAITCRLIGEQ